MRFWRVADKTPDRKSTLRQGRLLLHLSSGPLACNSHFDESYGLVLLLRQVPMTVWPETWPAPQLTEHERDMHDPVAQQAREFDRTPEAVAELLRTFRPIGSARNAFRYNQASSRSAARIAGSSRISFRFFWCSSSLFWPFTRVRGSPSNWSRVRQVSSIWERGQRFHVIMPIIVVLEHLLGG
jgi:hypothetical protein